MLKQGNVDFILVTLLVFLLPLFFYKLGQSSLVSFDEAWYADISRNVIKTGDLFNLQWNGKIFQDHPPAGFWFSAIAYKMIGVTNFSARFVSALAGFLGLVVTYFLGKELFSRVVGFSSAIVLVSSNWYLFRARSGNLDSLLTLFFITTIYFALKAAKEKKYLWLWSTSMILLFLTKTLVPFTIIPALVLIFFKSEVKIRDLIPHILLITLVVGYWFSVQIGIREDFFNYYFKIGLPGVGEKLTLVDNAKLMKQYLHNGIGKIFWPGFLAIVLGVLTFQKRFWVLSLFFASFFAPFLLSQKGHIWHLVPLHPFMILAFFGLMWVILDKLIKRREIIGVLLIVVSIYFSYPQTFRNWNEFINVDAYVSDEEILSRRAGDMEGKLFIDGDFVPAAVFYSGKNVRQMHARAKQLNALFDEEENFLFITKASRLFDEGIFEDRYEIIDKDRDKILIRKVE